MLAEQLAQVKLSKEQLESQLEQMKVDLIKFQAVAKTAHSNDERELNLHATAEKELRETRERHRAKSLV